MRSPQVNRLDAPADGISDPTHLQKPFQSRGRKDRHNALQDNLMYKTEVSLDEFIETFVPKLPEGVKVTSNFVTQMNKAQAWHRFLPYLSNAPGIEAEDIVFKRLTRIFNKMMVRQARKQWKTRCPKQQWSLLTAHSATPTTPERLSKFKPDAYFYRKIVSRTTTHSYYDMAFTAEFKKHSENTDAVDVSPASSVLFIPPLIRS
jgi:hypothetical protein